MAGWSYERFGECMLIRSSTVWHLPFTLLYLLLQRSARIHAVAAARVCSIDIRRPALLVTHMPSSALDAAYQHVKALLK